MSIFKEEGRKELSKINEMLVNFSFKISYPGEEVLKSGKKLFVEISNIKDTLEFYKEVYDLENGLLDYVEKIEKIKRIKARKIELEEEEEKGTIINLV